jgi:hypothetical protein
MDLPWIPDVPVVTAPLTPWGEAHALAGLARCVLAAGHPARAEALLRQALEIFQHIGAAEAGEVSRELSALTTTGPPA